MSLAAGKCTVLTIVTSMSTWAIKLNIFGMKDAKKYQTVSYHYSGLYQIINTAHSLLPKCNITGEGGGGVRGGTNPTKKPTLFWLSQANIIFGIFFLQKVILNILKFTQKRLDSSDSFSCSFLSTSYSEFSSLFFFHSCFHNPYTQLSSQQITWNVL